MKFFSHVYYFTGCGAPNFSVFIKTLFGAWLSMVLKFGRFGQQIRNTSKVSKRGAGEGWRRSVGPIM